MTIILNAEQQKLIQDRLKSGLYPSAEDVVTAALTRLVQTDGDFAPGELAALVKVGTDELDRGEMIDGEQVFEELRKKSAARRAKRAS